MNSSSDVEPLPVYENVAEFPNKSSGATPGPQVAAGQVAPPPYPALPNYSANQPVYSVMHPPRQVGSSAKASPQAPPYYHKAASKPLTQQQIDELNSSDYVCMTGNVSQTLSTNTHFQTTSAKSYERAPATGIAGVPTKPTRPTPKAQEASSPRLAPSPTPSAVSACSSAGKLKISGKSLLPYSVTPPRPRGPTEAERKIEEMTRQIEEEMEKHEEEGEYFGKQI